MGRGLGTDIGNRGGGGVGDRNGDVYIIGVGYFGTDITDVNIVGVGGLG